MFGHISNGVCNKCGFMERAQPSEKTYFGIFVLFDKCPYDKNYFFFLWFIIFFKKNLKR